MPVDPDWNPVWRIPLITEHDAADPLPEWFAKAFRERPGIGTIGKARKVSTAPAGGANKADLFAQIEAGRKLKKVNRPEPKPLPVQKPDANARRASDARRGSSADRRARYEAGKTALSASSFSLGMATGALAGSSGRTGTHAALATQLFASFLVEDAHVREATRRLQPQRATLLDAMEVEVRARANALDAAPVAASA